MTNTVLAIPGNRFLSIIYLDKFPGTRDNINQRNKQRKIYHFMTHLNQILITNDFVHFLLHLLFDLQLRIRFLLINIKAGFYKRKELKIQINFKHPKCGNILDTDGFFRKHLIECNLRSYGFGCSGLPV